jgi:hypothetical protein
VKGASKVTEEATPANDFTLKCWALS